MDFAEWYAADGWHYASGHREDAEAIWKAAQAAGVRMTDFLSPAEHQLLSDLGGIANQFLEIIHEETGVSGYGDYAEVATHIHALQNMVMGQAAARAYPTKYRLMGGEVQREDGV